LNTVIYAEFFIATFPKRLVIHRLIALMSNFINYSAEIQLINGPIFLYLFALLQKAHASRSACDGANIKKNTRAGVFIHFPRSAPNRDNNG
jgi:hypothetical protein